APQHLPDGRDTTLFVFGLPWNELRSDEQEYRKLDAFVRNGGRLVVTLFPQLGKPRFWGTAGGTNNPAFKGNRDEHGRTMIDLNEKWGSKIEFSEMKRAANGTYDSVTAKSILPQHVPPTLSWHSSLIFTNLSFDWKVIYARGTDPVMIERQLGRGSIVLATDSYFVSNEAMQKEREPRLLSWLAGTNREIIFDEAHLGVQETTGIARLARRYRLHGGVFALALLAALFVWKNSLSFVPGAEISDAAEQVHGRESAAGFVNLLRRSVASEQLLQSCLNEWHKSRALDRRASPRKLERVRVAVDAYNSSAKPNAVETYKIISSILNEK
ncbi:MAG TPA: DUF4350 domain-containing protein, partial [Candidatus Acidoferrum sp.]|nr:DUF4350 domain-containing protein [Candidatus Acidoferrum sp.]